MNPGKSYTGSDTHVVSLLAIHARKAIHMLPFLTLKFQLPIKHHEYGDALYIDAIAYQKSLHAYIHLQL